MLSIPQPTNMWDGHCASMEGTLAEVEDEDAMSLVKIHVRAINGKKTERVERRGTMEEKK